MAMLKRGTERAQGVTLETLREVKVGLGCRCLVKAGLAVECGD